MADKFPDTNDPNVARQFIAWQMMRNSMSDAKGDILEWQIKTFNKAYAELEAASRSSVESEDNPFYG